MGDARDEGHHLAMAAAIRVLAMHVARIANPERPADWFAGLVRAVHEEVEGISNPSLGEEAEQAAKEAAFDALRLMFDRAVFVGKMDG